jgi:hypothetical protein
MLRSIISRNGEVFPHDPVGRGFHIVYRADQPNHCPGCGRTHWLVGRFSAECAFCATALPLAETGMLGTGTHSRNRRSDIHQADAA